MGRNDEGNPIVLLRENSPEVRIPGVTVNEIRVDVRGVEIETALHRAEDRLQRFRTGKLARVEVVSPHLQPIFLKILVAEAAHIDIDCLRELACEITNVHSGATVNVRRVFVG